MAKDLDELLVVSLSKILDERLHLNSSTYLRATVA